MNMENTFDIVNTTELKTNSYQQFKFTFFIYISSVDMASYDNTPPSALATVINL